MEKITIAILGIGQPLCGDESAGLEAVRLWQTTYPETAADSRLRIEQPGTPGMELIDLLANADYVLLVDAVESGAAPGTLHMVTPEQIAAFGNENRSAHGWGVAERIERLSGGVCEIQQGTVYPVLQRLLRRGWVVADWRSTENNRRARYYRLTASGQRQLDAEIAWWRRSIGGVDRVLRAATQEG